MQVGLSWDVLQPIWRNMAHSMKRTVYVTRAIWVACGLGIGLGWMQMMKQLQTEDADESVSNEPVVVEDASAPLTTVEPEVADNHK